MHSRTTARVSDFNPRCSVNVFIQLFGDCSPDESYAVVKAPNGEMYVVAEALAQKVMKIGGFDSYELVRAG